MKNRTLILAVVLWGLMPAWSGRLSSQPLADYRLSQDRFDYALPEDIRIQAAGEIGSARLVVWGTRIDNGQGAPEHALVLNLNGVQRVLTSPESRPYGAVGVVPLEDRFLVVWNDRRSGEAGIWCRTVLTSGELGGQEYLFSAAGKMEGPVYWWKGKTSTLLFWTDIRTDPAATYLVHLSADGNSVQDEQNLGKGGINPEQTFSLKDGGLVLGRGIFPGYGIRADGRLEELSITPKHFAGAWYVEGDSAIAVFRDTVFSYYASLFDTLPQWSVRFSRSQLNATPRILSKDSIGWFLAIHQTVVGISYYSSELHRWRFDSLGGYSDGIDRGFSCGGGFPGNAEFPSASSGISELYRGPNNTYSVVISHGVSYGLYEDGGQNMYGSSGECRYSIDSSGRLRPYRTLPISSLFPYALARLSYDTVSSVKVEWGNSSDTAVLSVPIFRKAFAASPVRPNIVVRDSSICMGWIQKDGKLVFARYPSLFDSADLYTTGKPGIQTSPGLMWQRWDGGGYPTVSYSIEHRPFSNGGNGFVIIVTSRVAFHELSSTGWKLRNWGQGESYSLNKPMIPSFIASAYDPNHELHSLVYFYPEYARDKTFYPRPDFRFYSYAVDISATSTWYTGAPVELGVFDTRTFEQYVPISDSSGIVLMTKDTAVISDSHGSVTTVSLANSDSLRFVLAQRLYGDRFLRILSDSSAGTFRLELYATTGELIQTKEIAGDARHNYPFPLQRERDSLIVLLWGGSGGVRGTVLSKNLEEVMDPSAGVVLADVQFSATTDSVAYPCGIFRNDTLFMAWEDYHSGAESEIYGTWWPVPEKLRVVGENSITDTVATPPQIPMPSDSLLSGIRILSVSPSPAVGETRLTVESAERRIGWVELYDGLGRRVLAQEVFLTEGVQTYRVDVSQVPSGGYTLRIRSGRVITEWRLVVYQQ